MATSDMSKLLRSMPQVGQVEWIGLRPKRRAELLSVEEAEMTTEDGLLEDHYRSKRGKRQVTLIQAEHLQAVADLLQQETPISPLLTRRNIVVSGINLIALKNRQFAIGEEVILEGTGFCQPCSRMEENLGAGGYNAMRGHGGWYASVTTAGEINVGDVIAPN